MNIVVMMSTYNGAGNLEPQIRSILDQDVPHLSLLVRDDGSRDKTPEILRRLARTEPRLEVHLGDNAGLPHAFFELFGMAPPDADVYLLSDQDDIWHADKVAIAARQVISHTADTPVLYCSRVRLVSDAGDILGLSPDRPSAGALGNALIENICTGCTAAFNGALLKRLRQAKSLDGIMFHDWWAYLVAASFGTVIFDRDAHIDYRLHDHNVAGMPTSQLNAFTRRLTQQHISDRFANLLSQAEAFAAVYGDELEPDKRRLLDKLMALKENRRAAFGLIAERGIFRQSRRDDLIWRLALALFGAGLIGTR